MRRYLWVGLLLVLAAAAIGYRVLSPGTGEKSETSAIGPEAAVRIVPVQKGRIAHVLNTSGDILPVQEVDVVARIAGYVERIHFEIGDRVMAGQIVATVNPRDQKPPVEVDEAAVKIAAAALREKETQLFDAERQAERARLLREKDFISSQELKSAESRAMTAAAQKELAEAELAQRQAVLTQSRQQLSLGRIRAPISGVITQRKIDPGAYVSSSTPILALAVPDELKVVVNIPEKELNLTRVGLVATLKVDAFPNRTFVGRIARLDSILDGSSMTLTAEVHVPNRGQLLKPGMVAQISVILSEEKEALLIPGESVVEEEGRQFVYTVVNGKARQKHIIRGLGRDNLVAVTNGLEEGDQVVVSGHDRLKSGMKVRITGEVNSQ
ncbi:MAG: efflux RND transporter periplasmic adaptor subunit [Deltaproteobacteria bacterium]|nr:efflux RND transporter periplasmic adaptor subunit [Deltaproteobacteria bacterium]